MSPFSKFVRRFRSPAAAAAIAPAKQPLPYTRLSLSDWCSSPERVSYVAGLLRDPMFRELVAMLANVRPLSRGPLDATGAAVLLGQRIGHDQVIASLLAAGTPAPAPPADITADYNADNVAALWEREADA